MATSLLTSDILKFMSVRPTLRSKKPKKDIRYVEDIRIWQDSLICPEDDYEGLSLKEKLFELVKNYNCPGTYKEVKAKNIELLDALESSFDTRRESLINFPGLLDELIEVVTLHSMKPNFNRCSLICDVDCVIRKHSENKNITLGEFVEGSWYAQLNWELFNRLYILYIFKRRYPLNLDYVFSALRTMNVIKWLNHDNLIQPCNLGIEQVTGCLTIFGSFFQKSKKSQRYMKNSPTPRSSKTICDFEEPEKTVLNTLQDLIIAFNAAPVIHPIFAYLYFYKCPFNPIKPIGIGDLKIVRQKLCAYEAGEIAHIENVLKGESKERIHRRLDRLDDIFTSEQEHIQENIRDTQTTDRFEVKKEVENAVNEEIQANLNASGSVSGSYGLMQYTAAASAGFAYNRSTSDATRIATNFVKELVDKSVTRVQERVREERTTRRINEVEETNKHGINNERSDTHVSGIYRFVDKRYKSQLYNYGKRLMFEFVIPEPAFFYKKVFEALKKTPQQIGAAPTPPQFPKLQISNIDQNTVNTFSAIFNLNNILPRPADTLTIGFPVDNPNAVSQRTYQTSLAINQDYLAVSGSVWGSFKDNNKGEHGIFIQVGLTQYQNTNADGKFMYKAFPRQNFALDNIHDKVPVTIVTYNIDYYGINIEIVANLKTEALRKWQIDTYNKIMDAYHNKYQEFESKLAQYENKKESLDAQNSGVEVKGKNPKFNEEIIKAELKKHCITIITKDYDTAGDADFTSTIVPIGIRPNIASPAIDLVQTNSVSAFIQFIEQAFEWRNLTYLLYSYLWNEEKNWVDSFKSYDEIDPIFAAFLRAGSARILVPVHPSYEVGVMHFLYTREVWNGGEAPAIGDDLYIPIHEEIRNQQDNLNGAIPERDEQGNLVTWEYVVPTPLIYLQQSSDLPTFNCQ